MAFLIAAPTALAAALVTIALLARFPGVRSRPLIAGLALALVAIGNAGISLRVRSTLRAEQLRSTAVTERDRAVQRELASHQRVVVLTPAPLLTADTQAYDLSFAPLAQQRSWVIALLREYYRIGDGVRLSVSVRQPTAYCQPGVTAPWVGVQSCEELRARRR